MLDAYRDIDDYSSFDHYFESFESISTSPTNTENTLLSKTYVNGYGFPTCQKDDTINRWINKHNESNLGSE